MPFIFVFKKFYLRLKLVLYIRLICVKTVARVVLETNSPASASFSSPAAGDVGADAPSAAPRAGMDEQLNEMFHLDQRLADPDVAALFQRLSNSFKLREGERKKKRAQPTAFELFGDPTAAAAAAATGDSTQLYFFINLLLCTPLLVCTVHCTVHYIRIYVLCMSRVKRIT